MKNFTKRLIAGALACSLALPLAACGSDSDGGEVKYYDNEENPLRFSTLELDEVFNPFFSSSGTDSNVVGFTQLGMLGNDAAGNVTYGDDEAVLVKDLQIVTAPDLSNTTYYFVLKNNVKFSNGSPVSIKDVLFNLYVYLDMAYTGSSTIYSTEIIGLKEYRTQEDTEGEQDTYMQKYQIRANDRITALTGQSAEILKEHEGVDFDTEQFKEWLQEKTDGGNPAYAHLVEDYTAALRLFAEELEQDYSNSMNAYQDMKFTDNDGNVVPEAKFTTDVEVFLYNENEIKWSKKDKAFTYPGDPAAVKQWSRATAIQYVSDVWIPEHIDEVVEYWNTGIELQTELTNKELEADIDNDNLKHPNISGIKFANGGAARGGADSVVVNGTTYNTPTYDANGNLTDGYEVLSIKINKVDPKAIWNFAFGVAPMYWYSDAAHIAAFDYVKHFGVERSSQSFMENVVKVRHIGLPVGAGPYMAAKRGGGATDDPSEFLADGVVYFERNPYYLMGPAKIKKMRLVVVSSSQMLNSLYTDAIDFAEPNAKPETKDDINSRSGLESKEVKTSGYGYIGVNAAKIPDLEVRQAIMYCIDTSLCVRYYKNQADAIYRSMSTASWAYPTGCTAYYPYIAGPVPTDLSVVDPQYKAYVEHKGKKAGDKLSEDEQKEFIRGLVGKGITGISKSVISGAGYQLNDGVYTKGDRKCRYTFTIAGEDDDHPAWQALFDAGKYLNETIGGFDVTVRNDSQALKKLTNGSLTVWAAAWSSTIDPDMYQVYHKESGATSVLNWGYPQIIRNSGNVYSREKKMLDDLSDYIKWARETNDQARRKDYYSRALDKVMQMAVELPTYQRNDLFAYNKTKIDVSTFAQDPSPFKGLTSDLHLISLVTEK